MVRMADYIVPDNMVSVCPLCVFLGNVIICLY